MTRPRATNLSPRLLAALPTNVYAAECGDTQFADCGHWLHGTRSPEGNVVVAGDVCEFVRSVTAGTAPPPNEATPLAVGSWRDHRGTWDCGFRIEFVDELPPVTERRHSLFGWARNGESLVRFDEPYHENETTVYGDDDTDDDEP